MPWRADRPHIRVAPHRTTRDFMGGSGSLKELGDIFRGLENQFDP